MSLSNQGTGNAHRESILKNPQEALNLLSIFGRVIPALCLIGYALSFYPFDDLVDQTGGPLGGDYVMLYVAGDVVLDNAAAALYDDQANQARGLAVLPAMDPHLKWPFRYPPITAWLMSGLARLNYGWSFATFAVVTTICVVMAFHGLLGEMRIEGRTKSLVFWCLVGSPLVCEAIIGGQTSPLALGLVVACVLALRRKWDFFAGILLGLCIYKPNIVGLLVIGTVIARPRTFWGMLVVAVTAAVISIHALGEGVLQQYLELASSLSTTTWQVETPYWKVHGLAPLLDFVIPGKGKLVAFSIGIPVALWLGWKWRGATKDRWWLAMATLLTANSLLNPYVPIYDMLLVGPAGLVTVYYYARKYEDRLTDMMPLLTALAVAWFVGPHLSQNLALLIGWQVFPIILLMILVLQIRELSTSSTGVKTA